MDQGGSSFHAEEQDASKLPEAGQTHAVANPPTQKGLFMRALVPVSLSKTLLLLTWKEH